VPKPNVVVRIHGQAGEDLRGPSQPVPTTRWTPGILSRLLQLSLRMRCSYEVTG
jgi:hypothetical protein